MSVYATYSQYITDYLGNLIASTDFARLALRASMAIDRLTFDRAAVIVTAGTDTATIALIMMATCAVAEEIQKYENAGSSDGIVSESIGNSSVTYTANAFNQKTISQKLSMAAAMYLASTGLMFRGFASGEYGGELDADE
jgi:hypothetical protein